MVVKEEVIKEFKEHVLPFWEGMLDRENGGFYGYLDYDLRLDKKAVKGCILNSRILWFFSNAYLTFGDKEYLECADHAYEFMLQHCFDRENGGVFWSLRYDGAVFDDTKHTYNQGFAIYALASYYAASGKKEALDKAFALYELVESRCADEAGYLEAFTRDFRPADNEKLSENGVSASRTMNTLLHVLKHTRSYTGSRGRKRSQIGCALSWIFLRIRSITR